MSIPVVLLHGARTSRTMWRAQVEALDLAGHPSVAVDLPGHGTRIGSAFTVGAALHVIDRAVEEVRDLYGQEQVAVVGLSLGGYLGITWAARRPEWTAGLLAASCSVDPDTSVTSAWRLVAQLIGRLPDRGAWLNRTLVEAALPPQGVHDVGAGGFALDVMVDMLAVMRESRPLADLPRVLSPVWLVNGGWDHFRLQERTFAAAARRSRLVVVPRTTHLVNLVRPVAFNRVLLEFLEEITEVSADGGRSVVGDEH